MTRQEKLWEERQHHLAFLFDFPHQDCKHLHTISLNETKIHPQFMCKMELFTIVYLFHFFRDENACLLRS
jgi:hypothetical protein